MIVLILSAGAVAGAGAREERQNGRIVFNRFDPRSGKVRLWTVNPAGTRVRALTRPGRGEDKDSLGDWSPDGRRIVFRRFFHLGQPNERTDLLVVRADGTALRDITRATCRDPCLGSDEPAWSPDGRLIAFGGAIGPLPSDGPPPIIGIFVMRADGTHVRQLTQRTRGSGTEDHAPSWSPDGTRIAFMRSNNTRSPENASAIWVVSADGRGLRRVRRMPARWPGAGAPEWSPDGRRILYSTYCYFGDCGQPPTGAQLFTVRPDGTRVRQLTRLAGNAFNGAWSPDGRKIVFARNPRLGPTADVYTMRADGTHVRRVTRTPRLDTHNPDWGVQTR